MQYNKIPVLFILVFFPVSCLDVQSPLLSEQEYTRLMKAVREDWDVTMGKDEIIITSKSSCWFYPGLSLPFMEGDEFVSYVKESGRKAYYTIRLRFVPKWDAKKISAAERENDAIWEETGRLPEKHGVTHLMRTKTNSYFPETGEDKAKVAAYDKEYAALQEKLIHIPDFQSERYSIFISENRMGFEGVWNENFTFIDMNDIFPE